MKKILVLEAPKMEDELECRKCGKDLGDSTNPFSMCNECWGKLTLVNEVKDDRPNDGD